jgi:hypothetical protein
MDVVSPRFSYCEGNAYSEIRLFLLVGVIETDKLGYDVVFYHGFAYHPNVSY